MDRTYWLKQTLRQPLFDEIIWGKPQQKSQSGKLLVIGGNSHAITAPGKACEIAIKQMAGECQVVLPDKTRKLLGPKLPVNVELVESTPSGSFSSKAKNKLEALMAANNATLFIGDLGRSSETAILFESFIKLPGIQTYSGDAMDYWLDAPLAALRKPDALLCLTIAQLQKIAASGKVSQAFTSDMDLLQLAVKLHEFTNIFNCHILTEHQNYIVAASRGQVVTTKFAQTPADWQISCPTAATVWWMQNPNKSLQAIATAVTQLELS
jgi:hypothetical protein